MKKNNPNASATTTKESSSSAGKGTKRPLSNITNQIINGNNQISNNSSNNANVNEITKVRPTRSSIGTAKPLPEPVPKRSTRRASTSSVILKSESTDKVEKVNASTQKITKAPKNSDPVLPTNENRNKQGEPVVSNKKVKKSHHNDSVAIAPDAEITQNNSNNTSNPIPMAVEEPVQAVEVIIPAPVVAVIPPIPNEETEETEAKYNADTDNVSTNSDYEDYILLPKSMCWLQVPVIADEIIATQFVHDIDISNNNNPLWSPQYTNLMFDNLRNIEDTRVFIPHGDFLLRYIELDVETRSRAVSAMINIHSKISSLIGNNSALYLGVNVLDRYLSLTDNIYMAPGELFIAGLSALLLSYKHDAGRINIDDILSFIPTIDYDRTRQNMVESELNILETLNWQLLVPTVDSFFTRFSKAGNLTPNTTKIARCITERILLDYWMSQYPPSLIAASAVSMARVIVGQDPWTNTLTHYTRYSQTALAPCIESIRTVFANEVLHRFVRYLNSITNEDTDADLFDEIFNTLHACFFNLPFEPIFYDATCIYIQYVYKMDFHSNGVLIGPRSLKDLIATLFWRKVSPPPSNQAAPVSNNNNQPSRTEPRRSPRINQRSPSDDTATTNESMLSSSSGDNSQTGAQPHVHLSVADPATPRVRIPLNVAKLDPIGGLSALARRIKRNISRPIAHHDSVKVKYSEEMYEKLVISPPSNY
eukprot:gene9886-13296_t